MTAWGADVDELRQLAKTFNQKADVLENDVLSSITHGVTQSGWQGPDADQFRSGWGSALAPKVRMAIAALREQSTRLERNAEDQERTSSVNGSSSGPAGLGGSRSGSMSGAIKGFLEHSKEFVDGLKEGVEGAKSWVDWVNDKAQWVLDNPDLMKRVRDIAEKFGAEKVVDFVTNGAEGITKYAPGVSKFLGNAADKLGLVGDVLDMGINFMDRYQALEATNADMSVGERALTVGVHMGVEKATEWAAGKAGAWAGAAIGGAVGGPVGALIGGGIGYIVGSGIGAQVSGYVADAVTSVAAPVIDAVGDAVTNIASGAVNAVSDAVGSVGKWFKSWF